MEELIQKLLSDMKNMNLQSMRDQLASLTKLISGLASKDDLKNLEKELNLLKERVSTHDEEIISLRELINALKSSGTSS